MEKEFTKEELEKANRLQEEKNRQEAVKLYAEVLEKTGYDYIPRLIFSPEGGMIWQKELVKVK